MQRMTMRSRNVRTARAAALLLAALLLLSGFILPGFSMQVHAASGLTSIGLAEHALMAYRDGWQYSYGGYGNFNSSGVRASDCSGLVYSYLCWVDNKSNVKPNYSMPRNVTSQVNASSVHGSISSIPRTHGLLVTNAGYGHVGVYVGNGMVADNSTWGVNMRYDSVNRHGWTEWHKLDCITYPTTGWYLFDGNAFYYENGEYIVNATRTIDGVTYTFGSDGVSDKKPSSLSNSGYNSSASGMNASITGAGVRLRKGAGTNYGVITLLQKGTAVNVTSTANASWYAVTTGSGQKGYVSSDYVKLTGKVEESGSSTGTEPSSGSTAAAGNSAKTTTAVHLRSGRGTSYKSLGVIPAGASITVTDTSDSTWYGVTANGKSGYMHSQYIKMSGSASSGSNASAAQTTESTSFTAKTTAAVNLRDGRGTNTKSLGVIPKGTAVTVTDTSDGTWYGVTANGKSGYMHSQYIQKTAAADTAKTTTYVNLRSGAGTNHSVLIVIPTGKTVTVTDRSNSAWYQVTYNGKTGYVSASYLK